MQKVAYEHPDFGMLRPVCVEEQKLVAAYWQGTSAPRRQWKIVHKYKVEYRSPVSNRELLKKSYVWAVSAEEAVGYAKENVGISGLMEMRDITVGEYQFKIRPFGAKDATYIFGDVASIILPILGTVSVASDDKDAVNMEMFDGMDMDKDSLVKALARINGNALSKLVSELLLDHSNIRVLDPEKNTYEVMGEDDFDEIFCQYLAGIESITFPKEISGSEKIALKLKQVSINSTETANISIPVSF